LEIEQLKPNARLSPRKPDTKEGGMSTFMARPSGETLMAEQPIAQPGVATALQGGPLEPALEYVRQALSGLQFGQIAIIVQDGVVVQVERTERKRFRRGEHRS
jgi:hypothetical protein